MSKPDFETRAYDRLRDYAWVAAAWRAHDIEPMAEDVLPPTGVMVLHEGVNVAYGGLWLMNTKAALVGPLVASRSKTLRVQAMAIAAGVGALCDMAIAAVPQGVILALAHDPEIRNLFVKRGGFRDTGQIFTAARDGRGLSLDIIAE